MKRKSLLIAAVLAALVSAQAFAQFYAGGSLGFSRDGYDDGFTESSGFSFALAPTVGYELSGVLDVEGTLLFGYAEAGIDLPEISGLEEIQDGLDAIGNITADLTVFGIIPGIRYSLLNWGSLELLLGAHLGFGVFSFDVSGVDAFKFLLLEAYPIAEYQLTDMFSVYAAFGGVGIAYLWNSIGSTDVSASAFYANLFTVLPEIGFHIYF